MKSLAEFFTEHNARRWRGPDVMSQQGKPTAALHPEVCATANRGLKVFPVPDFARFSGYPEQLIAEATCNVARLEELAEEYSTFSWRVAIGPSGLCVLRTDGPVGRSSLAVLTEDQADCSTLCARRAETTWANFRLPSGMVLRAKARRLAPGVTILGDGESYPVAPSEGCSWANPWAEIEAVPFWLLELAFEPPSSPPGKALQVPSPSPRAGRSRFHEQPANPPHGPRKGYAICDQAGFHRGYRVCRRR